MSPRPRPPSIRDAVRLLVVDRARGVITDAAATDLPSQLSPGDLLVLNDAATIPASLFGTLEGQPLEVRLAAHTDDPDRVRAVLFGAGDWRTRTEDRARPPAAKTGSRILLGEGVATVVAVSDLSPRLVELEIDLHEVFRSGRPVQYAHLAEALELSAVQTGFASRPWAFEMPSAGRPLSASVLLDVKRHGVEVATLTHAAGLSATGDPAIDAALPLPERYEIPPATVEAVERAGRVVAAGTTVVRALEGCHANHGKLVPGGGVTDLIVDEHHRPRVVGAVISGIHSPEESHYRLLRAFAPEPLLARAVTHASAAGYHDHEFGDLMLLK